MREWPNINPKIENLKATQIRMWNRKYNGSKNSRPWQPKQPLPGAQAQTSNGGGGDRERQT